MYLRAHYHTHIGPISHSKYHIKSYEFEEFKNTIKLSLQYCAKLKEPINFVSDLFMARHNEIKFPKVSSQLSSTFMEMTGRRCRQYYVHCFTYYYRRNILCCQYFVIEMKSSFFADSRVPCSNPSQKIYFHILR